MKDPIRLINYDERVKTLSHRLKELGIDAFELSYILSVCFGIDKEAILDDIIEERAEVRESPLQSPTNLTVTDSERHLSEIAKTGRATK